MSGMSDPSDSYDDVQPISDGGSDDGSRDTQTVDTTADGSSGNTPEQDRKLVQKRLEMIRRDKKHFEKVFKQMDRDMFVALHGRDPDWSDKSYEANITGQHIKTKTAALYAKNPKIVSTRKEKMDFLIWDETQESLAAAMQTVQVGQQIIATQMAAQMLAQKGAGQTVVDGPAGPMPAAFGHNGGPPMEQPQIPPQMPPASTPSAPSPAVAAMMPPPEPIPGFNDAQALLQDVQQGIARRRMLKKFGKTLEILFADAMAEQTPLDFKAAMKRVVRRSLTTGVGYVEMGFQREYGVPPGVTDQLADYRQRINHLQRLMEEAAEGEIDELDAEMAELQKMLAALNDQPQAILRSGLTFDFLQSTKVIPDRFCTSLVGFIGCRHVTIEYLRTKAYVEETFGVELKERYTPYTVDGQRTYGDRGVDYGEDATAGIFGGSGHDDDLVMLFKQYDKVSGLVYWMVDGHPNFIKEPAAPDVVVPRFWPVYAICFNETENEKSPFPRSDVELLKHVQREINRSRQGKREHREAARPRFIYANGALDEEEDIPALENAKAFDAIGLKGLGTDQDVNKALQVLKMPGVDPNLYDTNEVLMDASLTVGATAGQLGGTAKNTATGEAIASGTVSATDSSSIDELDGFLTMIARDGSQVLMTNMSKDEVIPIAGPGAVWVEDIGADPEQIYNEVFLRVEAGSTGKPNQADEIRNFKDLAPLLLQTGAIPPQFLAREGVRRLDDRIDLTEAIVEGVPAIVAMNRNSQMAQGDPQKDPNQQGGEGGDKNATPSGPAGSTAPMGNNQHPQV
jgi:hypothetical protein